jgi:hypothetical protein
MSRRATSIAVGGRYELELVQEETGCGVASCIIAPHVWPHCDDVP